MSYGKRILITGAAHGIGWATALKFLNHGWEVYGCGSNREELKGIQMAEQNHSFHFLYADVSKEEEVKRLFDWCGTIDAAFNNAGIGCIPAPVHRMDLDNARKVLEVNLLGTALCMKYECAAMLEGKGVILNNSSVSAYKAATGADAMYSASKAGILRLTAEAAVCPVYRDKIKFFTLVPGWIETRMTAADDKTLWGEMLPSGRAGSPGEVAEIVYAIVENQEAFESGQEFSITGGGRFL